MTMIRVFRLCLEAAAWFVFVVLAVLACDPSIAAKVPLWRVAALALLGCAVARLVRWVGALATEAWTAKATLSDADIAETLGVGRRRVADVRKGLGIKSAAEQAAELRGRFPAVGFIPAPARVQDGDCPCPPAPRRGAVRRDASGVAHPAPPPGRPTECGEPRRGYCADETCPFSDRQDAQR
jgi:hypothetical protein